MASTMLEPNGYAIHFGENLRPSPKGHKVSRDRYALPTRRVYSPVRRDRCPEDLWRGVAWAYQDEDHKRHSDAYLLVQRDKALVNFDLSMNYFASLEEAEFENAVAKVLAVSTTFKPVESLRPLGGVTGAYVLVFDEFRQFYIGKGNDLRTRIKQHWRDRKPFDRLVFGSPYDSIFPVDAMGALDTTRIYAAKARDPYELERRAEEKADGRYCLNRIRGGDPDRLLLALALMDPRSRPLPVAASRMTWEGYQDAWEEVAHIAEQSDPEARLKVPSQLAALDLSIYTVSGPETKPFYWSRRDAVRSMAKSGAITAPEYAEYLTGIGETVELPVD